MLFVRGVYFEQISCRGLWVDFDAVYTVFFGRHLNSHFCCWLAPQLSRKCSQKLLKLQKNSEKFVHTHSYIYRVCADPGKVRKVMEFKVEIFQVWKMMENDLRYGKVLEKSWTV